MKYTRSTPKSEKTVKFQVGFIEEDIELISFSDIPWIVLSQLASDSDPRGILEHIPNGLLDILEDCNSDEFGEFLQTWVDASSMQELESEKFDDAFSRILRGFE